MVPSTYDSTFAVHSLRQPRTPLARSDFMQAFSAFFVGALLGAGFLHLVRRRGEDRGDYIFAAGLTIAAAIYAAFSMNAGPAEWVLIELAGVALFAGMSIIGYRTSILVLSAGWTLHIAWDLWHGSIDSIRFIPDWYPMLCVAFDLVVGVYLFAEWKRRQ